MSGPRTVEIDYWKAMEMLGFANTGGTLCRNILESKSTTLESARYITENEFAKWFVYIQTVLGPAVYGDNWKGPR